MKDYPFSIFLYSTGETPITFLNSLEKLYGSSIPNLKQTWLIFISVKSNRRQACWIFN